jgi:hypothetical protein
MFDSDSEYSEDFEELDVLDLMQEENDRPKVLVDNFDM